MRYILLITCLLCFVPGKSLAQSSVQSSARIPLELRITSPHQDNKTTLIFGSPPHLQVSIRNVSGQPLRLWKEWSSWGHGNLTLEIVAVDGKRLAQPRLLFKGGAKTWFRNRADPDPLPRNGIQSRIVQFATHKQIQFTGDEYQGFPTYPRPPRLVSLRAVFEIRPSADTEEHGIWTGRIVSAAKTFVISNE